jgi:hypothetical protein
MLPKLFARVYSCLRPGAFYEAVGGCANSPLKGVPTAEVLQQWLVDCMAQQNVRPYFLACGGIEARCRSG